MPLRVLAAFDPTDNVGHIEPRCASARASHLSWDKEAKFADGQTLPVANNTDSGGLGHSAERVRTPCDRSLHQRLQELDHSRSGIVGCFGVEPLTVTVYHSRSEILGVIE